MAAPTHRRLWGVLALALWAVYALPLYVPPATSTCGAPVPDTATLVERLFPGVPPSWVIIRILCCVAAAAVVAVAAGASVPIALPVRPRTVPRVRLVIWIAVAIAAAQLIAALWVEQFERRGQFFYLAVLLAPTVLLLASYRQPRCKRDRRLVLVLFGLAGAWVLLRLPPAWHSPRSADAVDMLSAFTFLEQTDNAGLNILTSALGPMRGVSYLFLVFHGAGLYGPEGIFPRTLHVLQVINVVWIALVSVGIGWLAARIVGRAAALVAAATFLFSPFMLLGPLVPTPMYHAVLVAAGLMLLWLAIHERRSPPAVAAFGTLAGVGCSHPGTLPFTVFVCAAALWSATRPPKLPGALLALGLLGFAAALYPGLPSRTALRSMQQAYTRSTIPWTELEAAIDGQTAPAEAQRMLDSGRGREGDVILGAVLAPVAIPRTAIRLWGDALFEPVGAALAVAGIVACGLALRRSVLARALLAALAVAMLPAMVSSYDRTSLVRMAIAPALIALLAGCGFDLIRRSYLAAVPGLPLAAAVAAATAIGGTVLFDVVTPRLLPASAFGIALEALGPGARLDQVTFLDFREWEFNWLGRIAQTAEVIGEVPVRVAKYGSAADLDAVAPDRARVLFWTPGLDAYRDMQRRVCARWPQARVYELADRPGCSRVFAASLAAPEWQPQLPRARWRAHGCGK